MAEAVIGGALLGVGQHRIGFVDFLEADFGLGVALVAIGVVGHGLLAEGGFQRNLIDGALDFQNLVITTLGHCTRPDVCPTKIRVISFVRVTGRAIV